MAVVLVGDRRRCVCKVDRQRERESRDWELLQLYDFHTSMSPCASSRSCSSSSCSAFDRPFRKQR